MEKIIKNPKKKREVDKKVLSFFMLAFPTLLIIALGMLSDAWWGMILLAFYQFILLKQFLDHYYDLIE